MNDVLSGLSTILCSGIHKLPRIEPVIKSKLLENKVVGGSCFSLVLVFGMSLLY
jgi:hypothetical protein